MKTTNKLKTLSFASASGAVLALSMVSGAALAADNNPFGMTELSEGYQVAMKEGKCGEGKCGGDKAKEKMSDKAKEAKCGEGKCGGDKAKGKMSDKAKEAKCGEGKCGGSKAEE